MTIRIGFLLFPLVQQLDLTGPYDVFASLPEVSVHLVWKDCQPLKASSGMTLVPDTAFAECPPLDVICVPGGTGIASLMQDTDTLAFIRQQAGSARFVTAVCTGSLLLGAAGLLRGHRATTHWAFHQLLAPFGAIPVQERVVRDGRLMTGGGITAGIDFALTLASELVDKETAQAVQLAMEYAPAPPFNAGHPDTAPAHIVERVRQRFAESLAKRTQLVEELTEGRTQD